MNLDTLTTADLYAEIADLARDQGVTSPEDWQQLVDETIDSHEALGELNDDQDLQAKKTRLYEMWNEYQRESGPESLDAIGEDPEAPNA